MVEENSQDTGGDRREFFRIDDTVAMRYQSVPAAGLGKKLERYQKGLENEFTIMGNLAVISQEMSGVLRKIEHDTPDVARYLKALDRKVDLLGKAFLTWTSEMADQPASAVNLSASGMAFNTPDPVEIGTMLELKLLLPHFTGLVLFAEVVACEQLPEQDGESPIYQTRVGFRHLREADRDVLIRHVLQRQSELLRRRRQQQES
ncbi:MAG: PilZ domain-containing protein [Gammaproteobacteria bacterium]|nr:PilZ domain-containing protein [Gammaproteobacteria bacterium]